MSKNMEVTISTKDYRKKGPGRREMDPNKIGAFMSKSVHLCPAVGQPFHPPAECRIEATSSNKQGCVHDVDVCFASAYIIKHEEIMAMEDGRCNKSNGYE
jgi:hypothetical protein